MHHTLNCSNRVFVEVASACQGCRSKYAAGPSSGQEWIVSRPCPRPFREAMQAAADVPKWTFRDSAVSGDLSSVQCALLYRFTLLPNSPLLMRIMHHYSISYLDSCSNPHPHSRRTRPLSCLHPPLSIQDGAPFTSHF